MTYFRNNYSRINFPIASESSRGLRNAQIGAIHAIGSHFTLHNNEPALVVMPTGSGKTSVLILSAFLLRVSRVLILSSSKLVRGQIADELKELKTLKESNVFHRALPIPKVKEQIVNITSQEDWEGLRAFDVVVGIPGRFNNGITEDLRPPDDLFDLVLVDEAHHKPASTWTNTVKAFPGAKKIYFTATPFRRDKKEIDGKMAFNYPLSKAYEDKIFGDIGYYPVPCKEGEEDIALAKETEKIFKKDREAGFEHYLIVRTDSKDHAAELAEIYGKETTLKLKSVNSSQTYKAIQKTITQLKNKELDGIICVDMLGEGFDFPYLKIASIHKPHKSLAVTLQFIGRFARTNAENIGEAKFLAVPNNIAIGRAQLYREGAIWKDIIKDLSEEKILQEDEVKAALDTFESELDDSEAETISFYNLTPYFHIKAYRSEGFNINGDLDFLGQEVIGHSVSEDLNVVLFITREVSKPKWIRSDEITDINHSFFLIYYDVETSMLFIHSSIRSPQFYDMVLAEFSGGDTERISSKDISKVLADLENTEFFNIGMKNRSPGSGESYRTISGPNAENSVRESHGRMYVKGHVFGKAISEGEKMTIGFSSSSKIWSNAYDRVPVFVEWCKKIAAKIASDKQVKTNTGLDNLSPGRRVEQFPKPVISATWNSKTFIHTPFILSSVEGEVTATNQLLDFSIVIQKDESDQNALVLALVLEDISIPVTYDFNNFYLVGENMDVTYSIQIGEDIIDLKEYLDEYSLHLYLDEFAMVSDHDYYDPPHEGELSFDKDRVQAFDWLGLNTDITVEFYQGDAEKIANGGRNSIHEALRSELVHNGYHIVIYDHGTGEVADFITVTEGMAAIEVDLVHVKGSHGVAPGDRVNDVYEVCMQAVKAQYYTISKTAFTEKVQRRTANKAEKFVVGSLDVLKAMLGKAKRWNFTMTIVQPGISQGTLSQKLSTILAATDDALQNNGHAPLRVLGS